MGPNLPLDVQYLDHESSATFLQLIVIIILSDTI